MENASKALIIAGSTLIAIIILTLLVFMRRQITTYQKNQYEIQKTSQISKFNNDFDRYLVLDDDGISGADVITLINKLNDYNIKSLKNTENDTKDTGKAIDYNIQITLTILNMDSFRTKYSYNSNDLFGNSINSQGKIIIDSNNNDIYNKLQKFQTSDGNNIQGYSEYKEFVSSTFMKAQDSEYAYNGQIQKIYIKFYN